MTIRRVAPVLEGACHARPLLLWLIVPLPLVLRVAERAERGGIHSAVHSTIHSATEPRREQVLQREHPEHDRLVLISRMLGHAKVVAAALRVEREPVVPVETAEASVVVSTCIRGRSSVAISERDPCPCLRSRQSVAISGNQWQSVAISGNQWYQ